MFLRPPSSLRIQQLEQGWKWPFLTSGPARPTWSVLSREQAWTLHYLLLLALASKPILLSTENGLLTAPLGPGEVRNTDTLDKLQQAVGEGQGRGREGRGALLLCKVLILTSPSSLPTGDGVV